MQCGEHEQYTALYETLWIDDGFGMMAMYKQDWINVGGIRIYTSRTGGSSHKNYSTLSELNCSYKVK